MLSLHTKTKKNELPSLVSIAFLTIYKETHVLALNTRAHVGNYRQNNVYFKVFMIHF